MNDNETDFCEYIQFVVRMALRPCQKVKLFTALVFTLKVMA